MSPIAKIIDFIKAPPVMGHDISFAQVAIQKGDLSAADKIFTQMLNEVPQWASSVKAEMAYEIGSLFFKTQEEYIAHPLKYSNADPLGCATRSVSYLRNALALTDRHEHPVAWRIVNGALGRALVRLNALDSNDENLIEAIPCLRRALYDKDSIQALGARAWFDTSKDFWTTCIALARAVSDIERKRAYYEAAETYLRIIVKQISFKNSSAASILLKADLGICLLEWGRLDRDTKKLEEAIGLLREALDEHDHNALFGNGAGDDNHWGRDKFMEALVSSLREFGFLKRPWSEPHLREAAALSKKLLGDPWVKTNPIRSAAIRSTLGDLLSSIAALNEDYGMLKEAEEHLRAAHAILVPYGPSVNKGDVEACLGLLLLRQWDEDMKVSHLEEAVALLKSALRQVDPVTQPMACAQTDSYLGDALTKLGEQTQAVNLLDEATVHYRRAAQALAAVQRESLVEELQRRIAHAEAAAYHLRKPIILQ